MDDDKYTTQTGGYRIWRTCETSDEEYDFMYARSDDFMFYEKMNLPEGIDELPNVGSESITFKDEDGNDYTVSSEKGGSGLFGSTDTNPTATYVLRVYYKDLDSDNYYIADKIFTVSWPSNVVTGLNGIAVNSVAGVRYYNLAGQCSDKPMDGVNIVVTTYTDGSTKSQKVFR